MHHTDNTAKSFKASSAKWLSVCLRTKWSWVRIPLLSLKFADRLNFNWQVVTIHQDQERFEDRSLENTGKKFSPGKSSDQ